MSKRRLALWVLLYLGLMAGIAAVKIAMTLPRRARMDRGEHTRRTDLGKFVGRPGIHSTHDAGIR
jgi:hypothetical protein